MIKLVSVGLLVVVASAASCKRDGTKAVVENPAAVAEVKAQFDILRDSVDVKWKAMTASDDQKIAVTRLLVRELQQTPGQNPAQLQGLAAANARLKVRRYTQQGMAESAAIDRYDAAQDSLLRALLPVAAPNGGAPTETARNLVEGIQQLDASVVTFRVQYDIAAKTYNNYLKLHRPALQSLGGQYATLPLLPLFTIGAEQ